MVFYIQGNPGGVAVESPYEGQIVSLTAKTEEGLAMETGSSEQRSTGATGQEPRGAPRRVSVVWGRVIVGFVLSATGGAAFGHAWTAQIATWWWLGGMSLLAGGLLLLSVAYARR